MNQIPNDIIDKIDELFPSSNDRTEVKNLIEKIYSTLLNIGPDQLVRSILVISNGRIEEVKEIVASGFYGDPRDVIMKAEDFAGNPGHYFISSF